MEFVDYLLDQKEKTERNRIVEINMTGFARDKMFEKCGIDMHNTKQYQAFMDGWNEKSQAIFKALENNER